MDFFNKKTSHFIVALAFLIFILFLNFLFFYPKFNTEPDYKNLNYLGNKDLAETEKLFFENIQPGDIVSVIPVSITKSYFYTLEKEQGVLRNIFAFFFFYNLFDKIFVNAMGENGYWHVSIYTGNKTLNSIEFNGIIEESIDEKFFNSKNIRILRVKTTEENKQEAINLARMHNKNKDISYSLKNGILIVFIRSTGIILFDELEHNKLVCSSYIASLYQKISFNPLKHFTYISPADIGESELTETIFVKNEEGVFIK